VDLVLFDDDVDDQILALVKNTVIVTVTVIETVTSWMKV
jgi:hypothetical protein